MKAGHVPGSSVFHHLAFPFSSPLFSLLFFFLSLSPLLSLYLFLLPSLCKAHAVAFSCLGRGLFSTCTWTLCGPVSREGKAGVSREHLGIKSLGELGPRLLGVGSVQSNLSLYKKDLCSISLSSGAFSRNFRVSHFLDSLLSLALTGILT